MKRIKQLPQPLRLVLSLAALGGTWFLIMANSAGPQQIITLNFGTYDGKSTCGPGQSAEQVTITTIETGSDCTQTTEPFCGYELVLPLASLGITDTRYEMSSTVPQYGYLKGTVGDTAVDCKDLYYTDLRTHIFDCRDTSTSEAVCVITLKYTQDTTAGASDNQ